MRMDGMDEEVQSTTLVAALGARIVVRVTVVCALARLTRITVVVLLSTVSITVAIASTAAWANRLAVATGGTISRPIIEAPSTETAVASTTIPTWT
jgi:hypothetical protein